MSFQLVLLFSVSVAAVAAAQPVSSNADTAKTSTRSDGSAASALLKKADESRLAGRLEEAVRLADEVLERAPANREAVRIKLEALLEAKDVDGALQTYDTHVERTGKEDADLLALMARAQLRTLSASEQPSLRVSALEELARLGDSNARASLVRDVRSKPDQPDGRLGTEALARLGDEEALNDLITFASGGHAGQRVAAVRTLKDIGDRRAVPALRNALTATDEMLRAAAAEALGSLGAREAIGALKSALQDESFYVRLVAAVALGQLGDAAASEILKNALNSGVPDVQLMVARGMASHPDKIWVRTIRPLLQNPDGLNRLVAAELLLPTDRGPAIDVLTEAAEDPNPTVRAEAARILASDPQPTLALLRPLLRDSSPWVRLHASRAIGRQADSQARRDPER
jgi:HEAT repeat protein